MEIQNQDSHFPTAPRNSGLRQGGRILAASASSRSGPPAGRKFFNFYLCKRLMESIANTVGLWRERPTPMNRLQNYRHHNP